MRIARPIRFAIIAGSLALIALQVGLVARGWDFYQYDFRAYYIGAALHAAGADPYSATAFAEFAQGLGLKGDLHPFLYAPYTLWLFAPLAWMSYPLAFFVWLSLQVAALGAVAWGSLRLLRVNPVVLALLMALGLNGTVAAVLRSGQITLITLALVMAGLGLLAARRALCATLAITLAALPKLWLAPMLGLVLHRFDPRRLALFALGAGLFAAVVLAGARAYPDYQASFSASMASLTEAGRLSGPQNGAALNALRNGFALAGGGPRAADPLWMGYVGLVALASGARYVQAIWQARVDLAYLFCLIALSLSLAMPRLMIYQWVVALPALGFVITHMRARGLAWVLLAAALLPTLYIDRYALGRDLHELIDSLVLLPWAFSNLAVILVAWGVLIAAGPGRMAPMQPQRQD